MLRLFTLIFSTLLLALPLTVTSASAAPARSAVHAAQASDDDAGDDATADEGSDPADDPADDPVDLGDLCALTGGDGADDPADDDADAGDDDPITIDLGVLDTLGPDDSGDPEDVPDPPDDPSDGLDCSGADAGDTPAGGGTHSASVSDMLRTGVVSTGSVRMSGPGVVTQELWLPAAAPAARHGLRAAGTGTGATRSTKARGKGKTRRAAGRTLGGRVVKRVGRAGTVTLKVRLNAAARRLLRGTKKDVRITVRTTTRVRGGKALIRNGTLVAHRKAGK